MMINFYFGTLIIQKRVESPITFDFKFRIGNNEYLDYSNKYFMGHEMCRFIISKLAV